MNKLIVRKTSAELSISGNLNTVFNEVSAGRIKLAGKKSDQFANVNLSDTISNQIYDDLRELYALKGIL